MKKKILILIAIIALCIIAVGSYVYINIKKQNAFDEVLLQTTEKVVKYQGITYRAPNDLNRPFRIVSEIFGFPLWENDLMGTTTTATTTIATTTATTTVSSIRTVPGIITELILRNYQQGSSTQPALFVSYIMRPSMTVFTKIFDLQKGLELK